MDRISNNTATESYSVNLFFKYWFPHFFFLGWIVVHLGFLLVAFRVKWVQNYSHSSSCICTSMNIVQPDLPWWIIFLPLNFVLRMYTKKDNCDNHRITSLLFFFCDPFSQIYINSRWYHNSADSVRFYAKFIMFQH